MRDSASRFRFSDPRPHTRKKRPGRCGPSRSPTQAWPVNPETKTMQRLGLSILFTSGLLAGAAATADGRQPLVTISPGGTESFEVAASSCPTFHWGGGGSAPRVELVVYRLSEAASQIVDSSSASPVLSVLLPGTARGWTPSLGKCLEAGGRYVWALRGVGPQEASEWSQPRFFGIARGLSSREVTAAIEVLMRFAESEGRPLLEAQDGVPLANPPPSVSAVVPPSQPTETAQASIPGTAALWVEAATGAGESHGVAGVTHSPQGSALAGENVGGGPDLLLRGDMASPDAVLTEGSLDRPSASDQAFEFLNSLGGVMTLRVDGVDVVTEATDGDTLAALGCAPTQVAQWNGSNWQCASTGTDTLASLGCSTDQITRFGASAWECSADRDTLAGLACSGDQLAQWDGAAWVCTDPSDTLAGLACADNQIAHWTGTAWSCGQPALTHHTCSDSGFPGDCTVNCPAGSSVWVGGCTSGGNDYLKINGPTGGASGPSGWRCQSGDLLGSSSSVTADLYCVVE